MDSKLVSVQTSVASFSEFEQSSQSAFFHNVLLILDQLSQIYLPFQQIEFIQIIFCIIQIIQTSFWGQNGQFWGHSDITNKLHYIAYFSSIYQKSHEHIILLCVFFSVVFIISLLLLIVIFYFNKTRRIIHPILFVIDTYFLLFGCVVIHPLASLTVHMFTIVIEDHQAKDIVLLIFSIIGFLLAELLF